ncbi:MAG: nucleotidyltransferase family protein, partial [Planctomycetia bacterium]|nr:nucleotidyltransferase family protein [Planctomycetia bacterium]
MPEPVHRSRCLDKQLQALLAVWPEDPERFHALWRQLNNPEPLLHHAARHGVLGVLRGPLSEAAALPPALQQAVDERLLAERLWQEQLLQAHRESLAALEAAGIRAAVLKGPILSERLYGDPAIRRSTDVDLLIDPSELPRALTALASAGYEREAGPSTLYYERYHHHIALYRPLRPVLELHLRLFTGFGVVLRAADVLPRCQRFHSATGLDCWLLDAEDEFLHLCIHAAGHEFERLAWLYDLKLHLRQHSVSNWPALFERAKTWGVGLALAFTLEVLQERLAVTLPGVEPCLRRFRSRWQPAT